MKKTRQRNSVCLSEEGKAIVKERMRYLRLSAEGLTQIVEDRFSTERQISVCFSTIRRFIQGIKVDFENFVFLCKVLELNPDQVMASTNNQEDNTAGQILPLTSEKIDLLHLPHSGTNPFSFMIAGTFSPNKSAQINRAICLLGKLLRENCIVTLVPDTNCLAVTGEFDEKKRQVVEVTLMHLEKLLLEYDTDNSFRDTD